MDYWPGLGLDLPQPRWERFEKLGPLWILRFGRNFLIVTKDSSLVIEPKMSFETPDRGCFVLRSSTGGELEEEPPDYTAIRERIFIPL
jgi:hypothetical protein